MSSVYLRSNICRVAFSAFQQPRCGLKLKSQGVDYYWRDYPYENGATPNYLDRAYHRKNENARSIAVEGNIAVGKGKFAQNFADLCDLKYTGDVCDDDFFVDRNFKPSIDYRDYNAMLPKRFQFYTTEMLYTDPNPIKDGKPLYTQQSYYMYRYYNWWKNCAHIFHTGQGFVTKRSPFSSYIFARALAETGRLSKDAADWLVYYDRNITPKLFWPHLFVYVRSPVSLSRANIDKRRVSWESGVSDELLTVIKQVYESEFLPKAQRHSEIFIIDAEDYNFDDTNDMQYLVEEICKLDLEQQSRVMDIDDKLVQWRKAFFNHDSMDLTRTTFSSAALCLRFLGSVRLPEELREGGLSITEVDTLVKILKRDPRFTEWSANSAWDTKSALSIALGTGARDPTRFMGTYDEDSMKTFLLERAKSVNCVTAGVHDPRQRYIP